MHAGILEVLHCILIESPEALNLIAEGHIKSIISLLDKHGRNHKVGVERILNRDWLYLPFPSLLLSNYCVLWREYWLLFFLALIFFKQIKKKNLWKLRSWKRESDDYSLSWLWFKNKLKKKKSLETEVLKDLSFLGAHSEPVTWALGGPLSFHQLPKPRSSLPP